ncbi:hypothetical protein C206_18914 [Pseudomonas putida TRO1]|uniref:Uncharacterized protein n=1 Tax=Pseudomonas putida TRO1 TaxID=1227924 RepID=A0AAD2W8E8_PSEPU|nr:hypothetical protein PPUTLS46_011205 [Pseudomonas putida LS46]ENY76084.1 hypothetical protein C206_18914 [Pseudomonas putida TRO1]
MTWGRVGEGVVRPRLFWRLLFAQVLVLASAGGGMIMRLSL